MHSVVISLLILGMIAASVIPLGLSQPRIRCGMFHAWQYVSHVGKNFTAIMLKKPQKQNTPLNNKQKVHSDLHSKYSEYICDHISFRNYNSNVSINKDVLIKADIFRVENDNLMDEHTPDSESFIDDNFIIDDMSLLKKQYQEVLDHGASADIPIIRRPTKKIEKNIDIDQVLDTQALSVEVVTDTQDALFIEDTEQGIRGYSSHRSREVFTFRGLHEDQPRSRTEELLIDQELNDIPVVNLATYNSHPKTVTQIPELEVLEPLFFGSAAAEEDYDAEDKSSGHQSRPQYSIKAVNNSDQGDVQSPVIKNIPQEEISETKSQDETSYEREDNEPGHHDHKDIILDDEEETEPEQEAHNVVEDNTPEHEQMSVNDLMLEEISSELDGNAIKKALMEKNSSPRRIDKNEAEKAYKRARRGGFDPESDAKISAAKYRVRQRNLAFFTIIAIAGIIASCVIHKTQISIAVLLGSIIPAVLYLAHLRHTVKLEQAIRTRRQERYRKSVQHKTGEEEQLQRDYHNKLVVVSIDDEDPIFDHLEMHPGLGYKMASQHSYHAQAV